MGTLLASRPPKAKPYGTTITAPARWASYLINGDASGLEPGEVITLRQWLRDEGLSGRVCVTCGDASEIRRLEGILTECLEYTFV